MNSEKYYKFINATLFLFICQSSCTHNIQISIVYGFKLKVHVDNHVTFESAFLLKGSVT